jgi:sec-independent protein translocase protein TatB
MFNIGPGELVVILILALVLLGPQRLPEVARTVGKGMRDLRRATEDIKETVETEFYKLEHPESSKPALRPPVGRTIPIEPVVTKEHVAPPATTLLEEHPATPSDEPAPGVGPSRPS